MAERIAVVTGAAGGIGRAVVEALAAHDFIVVATDLADAPVIMDVCDRASVERVAADVVARHGRVDVLVNNAGVFRRTPALALDDEVLRRIIAVNLEGTLRCTSVFGKAMAGSGGGRIIDIASISGVTGAALASVYAASKAGVIAAAQSAARELAPHKIVVNVIAPGFCDTPMLAPEKALVERFTVPQIPARRVAQPEEVAEVVTFLATCRTTYLTGSVIALDGALSVG